METTRNHHLLFFLRIVPD